MDSDKTGILLVNLGTPAAPTPKAVKAFLREFLHDRRVVDMTRWLWCPVLHGIILPVRAPKVAKLYQAIWMDEGSPLLVHSLHQQQKLAAQLKVPVEIGMTYGEPTLRQAITKLTEQGCNQLVILPLYPQYSGTTTAAAFDQLAAAFKQTPNMPAFRFIHHYFDHPLYIEALAQSIMSHWQQHGTPQRLLCSYHGIPVRYVTKGDPYADHCHQTTALLVEKLKQYGFNVPLESSFQSRFGREPWLEPYTDDALTQWARDGIKRVDVITPAFAVDCLETLEEIAVQYKQVFLAAGGEHYHFIPCLNDNDAHIEMMAALIAPSLRNVN